MVGWLVGWWLLGRLVDCLVGGLVSSFIVCLAGGCVGWLVGGWLGGIDAIWTMLPRLLKTK